MENRNKEISNEIYKQLGGGRFALMTGAKNFAFTSTGTPSLSFKIGRNKTSANIVKIEYNHGQDLYTVFFCKFSMKTGFKELHKVEGVYADMLREVFTEFTGLYTSITG